MFMVNPVFHVYESVCNFLHDETNLLDFSCILLLLLLQGRGYATTVFLHDETNLFKFSCMVKTTYSLIPVRVAWL